MDLYIATGPFHIFNILNLKLHENAGEEGILVIADIFSSAELYAENIRAGNLFKEVILLTKEEYETLDRGCAVQKPVLKRYAQRLNFKANRRLYDGLPFSKMRYTRIYMGGFIDALASFVAMQISQNDTLLYYFDDGLGQRIKGEYFKDGCGISDANGIKWKLMKKYGHFYQTGHIYGHYFYSPELLYGTFRYKVIRQIKPKAGDERETALFRKVFDYDEAKDMLGKYRFIYFHGGYEKYPELEMYAQRDEFLAETVCKSVKSAAVCIHPASDRTFAGCECFPKKRCPLEVSCLLKDIENKVFISGFSAAALNPKFVFDKEPYMILTYRLFDKGLIDEMTGLSDEQRDIMLNRMLFDAYRDKSKVYVPETAEELMRNLHEINEKIENNIRE